MGAFWSGTDTNDDCRGRYSVVIGKVSQVMPEIKCRFNYGNKHVELKLEDMFEDNNNYENLTYNWVNEIKKLSKAHEVVVTRDGFWDGTSYRGAASAYYGMEDYFSNFMKSEKEREGKSRNVGKCTECGKFFRMDNLEMFDGETLCERCATKMGVFHAC